MIVKRFKGDLKMLAFNVLAVLVLAATPALCILSGKGEENQ